MSCGNPHETDCSEVLKHLYEYLDREMSDGERAKFEEHFGECNPCLEKYGLEQAVKKLVKRCCGRDDVPGDLRSKVLSRIRMIRSGEVTPGDPALDETSPAQEQARPQAQTASQASAKASPSATRPEPA